MKFLRLPSPRQLMKMLTTARDRAGLTLPQLQERVRADREFAAKYERGEAPPGKDDSR